MLDDVADCQRVVLVLVAVGVVHVVLGWEWDLGVVVVAVGCELAVEVRCGDGVALAGLVVAKLECRTLPLFPPWLVGWLVGWFCRRFVISFVKLEITSFAFVNSFSSFLMVFS